MKVIDLIKSSWLLVVVFLVGCASGLNSAEKREYRAFEHAGVLVQEKDPSIGMILGILPGFGSFYAREPGYGVVNLLLWPISIFWDPISGYDGSLSINYDATKYKVKKELEEELEDLDDKVTAGLIDSKGYITEKNKIERKYKFD